MRSLIRPALFMIARLGLLLSVVAWVAGQWWQISLEVPFGSFGSGSLHLVCGSRGHAVIVFDPFSVRPGIRALIQTEVEFSVIDLPESDLYWPELFGEVRADKARVVMFFPGVLWSRFRDMATVITFRHWFAVTFFVLFYGILKRVFRKRVTEVADE